MNQAALHGAARHIDGADGTRHTLRDGHVGLATQADAHLSDAPLGDDGCGASGASEDVRTGGINACANEAGEDALTGLRRRRR